ncbi:MAG: formylglycine-generating enzyme family protein [Planctomycetes bacterium]|nr:formylglycine-generating enzyme family protein [Planctomycetota bacterium]
MIAGLALLLAGCATGSGGGGSGTAVTGGAAQAVAATAAPWLVLDLATGTVSARDALPDLPQPAYRDRLMAFRRIEAGAVALGAPAGAWARQADELPASAAHGAFYIAALEVTRAQWRRLAGGEPWRAAFPPSSADRDDLPALCLTAAELRRVLPAWRGQQGTTRLALPDPVQWEAAARPPGAGAFPWGDDHGPAAQAWAWTADSEGGGAPRPVGTLAADARGLHDLCGNAWELTSDGSLRGGGWCDPLSLARVANRQAILDDTPHEGAGARLVLVP